MYLYPWDALDTGVSATLDRLRECGINCVKVAAVYHSGKLLLPGNPRRKVFVPDDGAMYFPPGPALKRSRLRPGISSFAQSTDPLEEICRAAEQRHMRVDAWAVCLHNRSIANAHPDVCTTNVYGDRYPHALCPLQPDVRAYLHALISDLSQYPLRRIVLEALFFVPYKHYSLFEVEGVEIGTTENLLLSLCFCAACRRVFPALAEFEPLVKSRLGSFFRDGRSLADPESETLRNVLDARAAALNAFAAELHSVAAKAQKGIGVVAWAPARNPLFGVDLSGIAAHLEAIDWAYYQSSPDALRGQLTHTRAQAGPKPILDLLLRPSYPDTAGAANLAAKIAAAQQAGVEDVSFYNYGILPEVSLTWIRNALAHD